MFGYISDGDMFHFIIVGAGTAGCVLANRLTKNKNYNVLIIEAGGDPPIESYVSFINNNMLKLISHNRMEKFSVSLFCIVYARIDVSFVRKFHFSLSNSRVFFFLITLKSNSFAIIYNSIAHLVLHLDQITLPFNYSINTSKFNNFLREKTHIFTFIHIILDSATP